MKVLFIGGTGVISSACAALAVERGIELYLLNRGQSWRQPPAGARVLRGDIRDHASAQAALAGHSFDSVVEWLAYTPEHVASDLALLRGRVGQYVFISSASAYQKPPARLPITEETPLENPFWDYSRAKIACEELLMAAWRDERFPVTIVRPSHTYDASKIPLNGGYTALARLLAGRPLIIHGDGASVWTLTHHRDFARGFVPLLGEPQALGEAFHITGDEWLTWDGIAQALARAAGVTPHLIHVPSELIAAYDPVWGAGMLGDKAHSAIFDNSKIRSIVPDFRATIPFEIGAREIVAWHAADPARQQVDERYDAIIEQVIAAYRRAWPQAH